MPFALRFSSMFWDVHAQYHILERLVEVSAPTPVTITSERNNCYSLRSAESIPFGVVGKWCSPITSPDSFKMQ